MTLSYEAGEGKPLNRVWVSPAGRLFCISCLCRFTACVRPSVRPSGAAHLPQGSAQLLVRHPVIPLPLSPHLGQGFRLNHSENALLPVFPLQDAAVLLRGQQQVSDKFPQVRTLEAFARRSRIKLAST